jgi:hypothetical protein
MRVRALWPTIAGVPLVGALASLAPGAPLLAGELATSAAADPTATVQTDFPCYLERRTVRVSGSGFAAGTAYTVALDGTPLGPGTVAADGTLRGTLSSGRLYRGATHQRHTLQVSDGTNSASAQFQVTRFTADFRPSRGNPHTLLVRFSAFGFGVGSTTLPTVYLHYIRPDRRTGPTVRLGRTHGVCGSLPRTRSHHLFPFSASAGHWRLQFDASSTYSPHTRPRLVRTVAVR